MEHMAIVMFLTKVTATLNDNVRRRPHGLDSLDNSKMNVSCWILNPNWMLLLVSTTRGTTQHSGSFKISSPESELKIGLHFWNVVLTPRPRYWRSVLSGLQVIEEAEVRVIHLKRSATTVLQK